MRSSGRPRTRRVQRCEHCIDDGSVWRHARISSLQRRAVHVHMRGVDGRIRFEARGARPLVGGRRRLTSLPGLHRCGEQAELHSATNSRYYAVRWLCPSESPPIESSSPPPAMTMFRAAVVAALAVLTPDVRSGG